MLVGKMVCGWVTGNKVLTNVGPSINLFTIFHLHANSLLLCCCTKNVIQKTDPFSWPTLVSITGKGRTNFLDF